MSKMAHYTKDWTGERHAIMADKDELYIVPPGGSPPGTAHFSDELKLRGMQAWARENPPGYGVPLADYQNRVHAPREDVLLEYVGVAAEARPVDMAVWRAILAGQEAFAKHPMRAAKARSALLLVARAGRWDRLPPTPQEAVRRATRGDLAGLSRFVLFTHPVTGGRAVYSEPVD